MVSPFSIYPTIHGGAVRIFNLIRQLSDPFDVSILIFVGGTDDPIQRAALQPYCRHVFFQKHPEDSIALDRWQQLPPSARRYASPVVAERISALVDAQQIDVVLLEYTEMGVFRDHCAGAPVVLVEHDLSFRSHARQRSLGMDRRYDARDVLGRGFGDWLRRYHLELESCRSADQVHVMSEEDRDRLASFLPDGRRRIRVIPNGVDTEHYRPPDTGGDRRDVLFVGSFPHLPNLDAFDYLMSDVWPLVRRRLPSAELTVAGARPPQRVLDRDGVDGVHVAGEVPDLAPLYRTHRVLAVPIRAGSGTRLKILEAMASGLPVVSTTIGAEGIDCRSGRDIVIADKPENMAAALAHLTTTGNDEAKALARNGRRLATERYDWARIGDRLRLAIAELAPERDEPEVAESRSSDPSDHPNVSILVIVRRGGTALERCLDGVARQQTDRSLEIVAVDLRNDAVDNALLTRHGARVVPAPDPKTATQGSVANLAARAASGHVLVYLAEDAVPAGPDWLELLARPFDVANAPAAVLGSLHTEIQPGGPPYDPFFTAETRRWRKDMGGFAFSLVNAAVAREVWQAFPFAGGALVGRRWQRQAAANGLLILPCWDATVHWNPPSAPVPLAASSFKEGRSWKRLGVRYGPGTMLADIRRGRAPDGSAGEAAPVVPGMVTRRHRLVGIIRPLALWLGNHLPSSRSRVR